MEKLIAAAPYVMFVLLLVVTWTFFSVTGGVYMTGVAFNCGLLTLLLIKFLVWNRRKP